MRNPGEGHCSGQFQQHPHGRTLDKPSWTIPAAAATKATIATAVGEQAGTIEEVYEPFLIMEGYLMRTPRGRLATDLAFKHLNKTKPTQQNNLF